MPRFLLAFLLLACACTAAGRSTDAGFTAVQPPPGLPVWSTHQARSDRYVSAHGLRAFAGGYSEDGLEVWAFPLQIGSRYGIDILPSGKAPVPGISVLDSVAVDPLGVTRTYVGAGFRVLERITTHARQPGVLVSFRVEGSAELKLRVHFHPSLNLMWPAAIGGQEMAWDSTSNGLLLSEPLHRFSALIASPQTTAHTRPNNDRRDSRFTREVFMTLTPAPCGAARCATLVFAGQSEANEDVHATVAALEHLTAAAVADDARRFEHAGILRITTPDAAVNRALRWSQIALEQAWTCNARLGCGIVAGYGPSHGARRPQYAWYFAGDGLVATRALIHEGDYARAAGELDLIYRYQKPDNGMIWHEITQSAGFLNWAKDYPNMYVHVDITFDFLDVLADYDRATGDHAFLARHWPATLMAYRYCLSLLDSHDGLPRVPADKMSGDEQDRLTDEISLSAAWVNASHAMSELAASMHDDTLSRQAEAASARARASVRARYLDPRTQRWISGFSRSGKAGESTSGSALAAITSGAATPPEASAALNLLATPAYLTGWGLRSTPTSASNYDPSAYAKGSVWSHGTAAAADIMWQAHRSRAANALWLSLVPWAVQDSLGHMHEVMSGSTFTPQSESVPEQTWSSAGFLSAAIHGLLGLDADARTNTLRFAPQMPASWHDVRVQHVRIGNSRVDLRWHEHDGRATLEVSNSGPEFRLRWSQAPRDDGDVAPLVVERRIAAGSTRLTMP
ncbi:MAG: hypothetical protein M3Y93_03200 [Pseudomonadota bacterium]|nr:hypothetical protein [Pseudomonadota bacterium]